MRRRRKIAPGPNASLEASEPRSQAVVPAGPGGSVIVADDETASGSGLALDLYQSDVATMAPLPALPVEGTTSPPYSPARPASAFDVSLTKTARLTLLREKARIATAYAAAIETRIAKG